MIKQNKNLTGRYRKVLLAILVLSSVNAVDLRATALLTPLPYGAISQQQKDVLKGNVKDENGEPIIGANVTIKGQSNGTITDLNGNFVLKCDKKEVLVVSFIGYKTQMVNVENNSFLSIRMESDTKLLDEVVVVGYGTTSVRKNSASISTVDTKPLKAVPYSDMTSALQGRVAGVIVQQGSAEPGQNGASVSIRGNGEPLYVIDGFVADKGRFLSLNKDDIKSTTVLKDAASTAVYGMNAGNGVILVTTKQGEEGRLNIDYQSNFGFNQLSYPTERMNAYDYATAINKLNQGLGQGINSFKSPKEMEEIAQNLDSYTNWEKTCMKSSAPQNEHSLSINGGSQKVKFYGSLNYLKQGGIYKTDVLNLDRYNYRTNVSSSFDKIGVTVDLNVNGSIKDEKYPGAGAWTIYSRMRDRTPFEKPYNENGTLSNQFDNPMLILDGPGYVKLRTVYNQLAARVNWDLPWVKGLSLGFDGNYNVESQSRVDWNETATYYDENGNATIDNPSNISISRSAYMDNQYDWNFRINYKTTIKNNHNIQATVIHTRQFYKGDNLKAGSNTFYTTAIKQIQKGDAASITGSNWEGERASMGYVGRLHYDFKNQYIIEFSGRYDGSDDFPSKNRFGIFPSVSLGWAISEEGFFKKMKQLGIFDYLKMRGSYGQIGINGAKHWDYAYLSTYNYNTNAYVVDGKLVNTVTPGPTPSVNMTWYTRTKYDIGFDFMTLNNKLEGTIDWFFEKTKGFLSANNYRYTAPIGYELPLEVSKAEDRIEGLDGSLKYSEKVGDLDFSVGANFTLYNSLYAKTNEDSVTLANPRIRKQGNKMNYVGTGYIGTQFYNSPEEVLNNPKRETAKDLRPGDLWYADINGDGKIDGQDQHRYGHNSSPSFVYGFDIFMGWKGFNVMANIQGTGPRETYMNNFAQGGEGERRLDFKYQLDTWSPDNRNATFPRPGNNSMNSNNNYASSDFWSVKSHYVRLKSLTVSYNFKYSLLRNVNWLQNLTVFASGVNLLAIGPSVKYGDPEANNFDGYSYPMMRTYSIGFQLGF